MKTHGCGAGVPRFHNECSQRVGHGQESGHAGLQCTLPLHDRQNATYVVAFLVITMASRNLGSPASILDTPAGASAWKDIEMDYDNEIRKDHVGQDTKPPKPARHQKRPKTIFEALFQDLSVTPYRNQPPSSYLHHRGQQYDTATTSTINLFPSRPTSSSSPNSAPSSPPRPVPPFIPPRAPMVSSVSIHSTILCVRANFAEAHVPH